MKDFVYITDTHFKASSSVRTGDYLEDLVEKLEFVVDYCNKNDCILLHGGDVFDTPSVPDLVKNKIFPILRKLKSTMYALAGNHCLLYNSEDYKYKTSFQTCVESGIFEDFDNKTLDLGDVVLTSELPIIQRGKPQIVIYHGFLNQLDGRWTFSFSDIKSDVTDQVYVCLGHDHTEYEPVVMGTTKIFRIGSFARVSRDEAQVRIPKLLHIKLINGTLKSKLVPIGCARPEDEIFRTKMFSISKSKQSVTYDSIINQIKQVNQTRLSLKDALLQVTSEDVYNYIQNLLDDNKLVCQTINKNL